MKHKMHKQLKRNYNFYQGSNEWKCFNAIARISSYHRISISLVFFLCIIVSNISVKKANLIFYKCHWLSYLHKILQITFVEKICKTKIECKWFAIFTRSCLDEKILKTLKRLSLYRHSDTRKMIIISNFNPIIKISLKAIPRMLNNFSLFIKLIIE